MRWARQPSPQPRPIAFSVYGTRLVAELEGQDTAKGYAVEIIDGIRELGLPAPDLDHLATVDNLELVRYIVALRCASRR